MKRIAVGITVALVGLAGMAFHVGTPGHGAHVAFAHALDTGRESVDVSPDSGALNSTFTVTGTGFAPGALVDESFADPTGKQWQFADWNNFNVNQDGSWGFTYNFGQTTQAASLPSGRWSASYCYDDNQSCYVVDFIIQ